MYLWIQNKEKTKNQQQIKNHITPLRWGVMM